MKYYLYISDSKVDMLLPQITESIKKKTATEYKFDLKVFSASKKLEDNSENRVSRLEAVCEFIHKYGNVGTVDEPNEYIFDTMDMSCQMLPSYYSPNSQTPAAFYFTSYTLESLIGLGGSLKHMIGEPPTNIYGCSSGLHTIYRNIKKIITESETEEIPQAAFQGLSAKNAELEKLLMEMGDFMEDIPTQRVEFLAKRLWQKPVAQEVSREVLHFQWSQIILASPLYISLSESPFDSEV